MTEEWRAVAGFEGRYEVSNFGRVKSLKRMRNGKHGAPTPIPERIMKPSFDRHGYLKVCLRNDHGATNHSVHQLVAKAFIPNPNGYQQINHIDEDKTNNHFANLEWCTPKYNSTYGTRLERCGKSRSKPVVGTNDDVVMHFDSARQASRVLGIDASSITAVCKGRAHTAGGYKWRYDSELEGIRKSDG